MAKTSARKRGRVRRPKSAEKCTEIRESNRDVRSPASFEGRHCVYCGDCFEVRDHVVPIAWQSVTRSYERGSTVPCCNLCNSLLGDAAVHNITDRAIYLHKRYNKRRGRWLKLPDWEPDEIERMGYSLRMRILAGLHMKALISRKLDNLELVMYGFDPIPLYITESGRIYVQYANEKANK